MNRQTILARINHHLRESLAETGQVRPLGEIVPSVAEDIRLGTRPTPVPPSIVIPMEQVAAFVDGQLNQDEIDRICHIVMYDNGVLAELVSAVRANYEWTYELDSLPHGLESQLLAMQADLPHQRNGSRVGHGMPATINQSHSNANGKNLDIAEAEHRLEFPCNGRSIDIDPLPKSTQPRKNPLRLVSFLLAVAATILAIIFIASRGDNEANQPREIAAESEQPQSPAPDGSANPGNSESPASIEQEAPNGSGSSPMIAIDETNNLEPDVVPPSPIDTPPNIVQTPKPIPIPVRDPESPIPNSLKSPVAPRLANLRWTNITGLLAQKSLTSTGSSPRESTWRSVPNKSIAAAGPIEMSLQTLPLSRAEADFEGGGRLVIAGDTAISITKPGADVSASFELRHGSISVSDLPDGTVIEIKSGDATLARLGWPEKAAAVLQRQDAGLNIHVNRGTIEINEESIRETSLNISRDQTIKSIPKLNRIPRWVDQPTNEISIPRNILAQVASSKNVMQTLSTRIKEIHSSDVLTPNEIKALPVLTQWQASLAGDHVYRLASSPYPTTRFAAFQRLLLLAPNDPRYYRVWSAIERSTNSRPRTQQVRRWCEMIRRGIAPSSNQLEQMVSALSAQDLATRAIADHVLRQMYGNNVRYDPTWSGARQRIGVNAWRKRVGLVPRTPAAAAGVINRQ